MSTVTADITVAINVNDTSTGGSLSAGGTATGVAESAKINYNATSPNTNITKEWSGLLTLLVSTPQTLNLASLTGPLGSTVVFASVVAIYIYNTGIHPIAVGNAATNVFAPGWSETTHVETINAGSRWMKETNGAAWTVDGTHENLMFDPSTLACSARVIILGN